MRDECGAWLEMPWILADLEEDGYFTSYYFTHI